MKNLITIVLSMFIFMSVPISAFAEDAKKVEAPAVAAAPAPAPVVAPPAAGGTAVVAAPAAVLPVEVKTESPELSEYTALIKSIGGAKGMGVLGIIALIMQVLVLLARGPLGQFAGRYKLVIIYVGTLVMGVIGLKVGVPDMDWLAAILHSNTLAMLQVTGNQVKKQFIDKKDEPAHVPAA